MDRKNDQTKGLMQTNKNNEVTEGFEAEKF